MLITALTLVSYFVGHRIESGVWEIAESPDGVSMAFLTLSLVEVFHSFNMRSRRESLFRTTTKNKFLNLAAVGSLIAIFAVCMCRFSEMRSG